MKNYLVISTGIDLCLLLPLLVFNMKQQTWFVESIHRILELIATLNQEQFVIWWRCIKNMLKMKK